MDLYAFLGVAGNDVGVGRRRSANAVVGASVDEDTLDVALGSRSSDIGAQVVADNPVPARLDLDSRPAEVIDDESPYRAATATRFQPETIVEAGTGSIQLDDG